MKNSSLRFLALIAGIILWGLVAACGDSVGQTAPSSAKGIPAISTPAATHYEIVKQSLLEGKNVFVEKCQG
jgi:hypothetical protein